MKLITIAAITSISILLPAPVRALEDRMDRETMVDFAEYICGMYRSGRSNGEILRSGSAWYLQHGNVEPIAPGEEVGYATMQRRMLALNETSKMLDVAAEARLCQRR